MPLSDAFEDLAYALPDAWVDADFDVRVVDADRRGEAMQLLGTYAAAEPSPVDGWDFRLQVASAVGGVNVSRALTALRVLDTRPDPIRGELVLHDVRCRDVEALKRWAADRPDNLRIRAPHATPQNVAFIGEPRWALR